MVSFWIKGAWPDLFAFFGGLGVAWLLGWRTKDLIWSLWLSSLVVGYASIIVGLIASAAVQVSHKDIKGKARIIAIPFVLFFTCFLLGFFTIHFGGFHFGHAVFLNAFFPLMESSLVDMNPLILLATVFSSYWFFLPMAFIAERKAFISVFGQASVHFTPMRPYINVVRMHLLIFFFAFVRVLGAENFFVYAVVYAVYFFPWSLLKKIRNPNEEGDGSGQLSQRRKRVR